MRPPAVAAAALVLLVAAAGACGGAKGASPAGAAASGPGSGPSAPAGSGGTGAPSDGSIGAEGAPGGAPASTPSPSPPQADDWPQYRHDVRGTSASAEQLTAADAAALREAWTREVGQYPYGQPIRAGDLVYVTTAVTGQLLALDAATGAERWRRDLRATTLSGCGGADSPGIWGAAAVSDGALYVAAPDGLVHALDAATGATRWQATVASPAPHAELVESSPAVSPAAGRLYVGVAATAHCDPARGRVAAVELASGSVVEADVVGAGRLGGGVWSSLSVDEAAGVAFAATGNAVGAPADEPLAQAVVALDAATLAPRDHWQNPVALENCDFGASPTLFEDAAGRKLLAVASKDGWLYVLDRTRLSAGPVWKRQLAVLDPAAPHECGDPLKGFGSIVSPAFAHGLLYAGGGRTPDGHPGSLVALDPATGEVRFAHATPGFVLAPPAVVGDVVAVASNRPDYGPSTLELLDARTGAVLRAFTGASSTFAPPSFARGLLLWVTFEGHLRALGR